MGARISLGLFFIIGMGLVVFTRAIQGVAIKQYERNPEWARHEFIHRWVLSESYIWSVRILGIVLMVFVVAAVASRATGFRGW